MGDEAFDANGASGAFASDLLAAGSSVFADNLRFEVVVPEPATAVLLGSGFAALAARSRSGRRIERW